MLSVSVPSSGTQGQAGNFFSLAAPSSPQPLIIRQQTPKIVPKSPTAASGGNVPSVPIPSEEGLVAVAAGSWRTCFSSTPYCHPGKYFTGHQCEDMLMAIYLLRQWLATQERPYNSLESRTLSMVKLHLFPKMREGGGLVAQSSNQLLAWMESSC